MLALKKTWAPPNALDATTRCLALTWRPLGIRVNAVAPGG